MKFEELSKNVAVYLIKSAAECDYESFDDMKKSQWWEPEDVQEQICQGVAECGGSHWDDMTMIFPDSSFSEGMEYEAFSKLFMKNIRKIEKAQQEKKFESLSKNVADALKGNNSELESEDIKVMASCLIRENDGYISDSLNIFCFGGKMKYSDFEKLIEKHMK